MMTSGKAFLCLAHLVLLGGCGGGGGDGGESTPPQPVPFPVTLLATGSVNLAPGGLAMSSMVASQAQLNAVFERVNIGKIPEAYRAPDFAAISLIYVEGGGTTDPTSSVRISQAFRNPDGSNAIGVELCAGAVGVPATYRPFALYSVSPTVTSAAFALMQRSHPNCLTVGRINAALVAAGDSILPTAPVDSHPSRVVSNPTEYAALQQRIVVPTGFAPDFASVNLIYLEGAGDLDPTSFLRVLSVLESVDHTVDISVEFCGNPTVNIPTHRPYALYTVPRLSGQARINVTESEPPGCFTTR